MQPFNLQPSIWNTLITQFPNPHFLQTSEWAQVKAKYGWQPMPHVWYEGDKIVAAAMILKRTLPLGGFSARLSILYAPKAPLMDWENESLRERVLGDLQHFAKKQGAIFVKIDPDVRLGTGIPEDVGAEKEIASAEKLSRNDKSVGGEMARSALQAWLALFGRPNPVPQYRPN